MPLDHSPATTHSETTAGDDAGAATLRAVFIADERPAYLGLYTGASCRLPTGDVVELRHKRTPFMKGKTSWEGITTDLLKAIKAVTPGDVQRMKEWPKAANSFSAKLRRAAPGLRMTGIEVNERTLHGQTVWTLTTKTRPANDPSHRTHPTPNASEGGDRGDGDDDLQSKSFSADPIEAEIDPLEVPPMFDRRSPRLAQAST